MKKKTLLIAAVTVICLVLNIGIFAIASTNTNYNSNGKIIFDNNTPEATDDVIFDAGDLKSIDNMITNGKAQLASSLSAYPNVEVLTLDTFSNLSAAIDTLTEVPDVYYYDKATEGDACVRYIYEDGSYYPCNEYGEKTSDTALTGTITVVTKGDTTEPAVGETQLVKYEQIQAANLSAGSAGYVDKTFILGSGSDNISYRNQGYTDGYDDGLAQNNVKISRHTHTNSCYCQGSMVITEKYKEGTSNIVKARCNTCGATAKLTGNGNWWDSAGGVGASIGTHYGTAGAKQWLSGQWQRKLCAYDNNQIISIKINGVEYLN